jgi:Ni/Co efflux regulator RcnB
MKSKTLICAATIASLGFASVPSFAQGHGHDRDHDRRDRYEHRDHRGDRDRDRHDEYAYGARGPEWHRGGHIPRTYRDRQYVVTHWQEHHLRRPPRGYEWVQVGGDYVLVAIATGLIADILLNH